MIITRGAMPCFLSSLRNSRFGVAAALDQGVEHDPMLVHGAPEPVLSACNADDNLVEVPLVTGCRKTAADLVGIALPELQRPLSHRLMADQDAAGSQHFLYHPQAERKSKVQPHSMADHFSRKAVASVARITGRSHPSHMRRSGHPPVNLTVRLRAGWAFACLLRTHC